jgi:transcriptional regulator with XRE-family HTH domain
MLNTGEILEKYLKGRMSMTDLAGLLGITPQYISSVLNNTKRPSKNFLEKFYMIFDVIEEDKKTIESYEEFRRLPENFQKEYLKLKEKNSKNTPKGSGILKFPLKAIVESGLGLLNELEKEEYISIPETGTVSENSFFVKIHGNELEPEFINKDMLLIDPESCGELYLMNNKICVLKHNNELFLRRVEYFKEAVILRCINNKLNPVVITGENIEKIQCTGRVRQIIRYLE